MLKSLNHVYIDIQILTVLKFTIKKKNQENQFSILYFVKKREQECVSWMDLLSNFYALFCDMHFISLKACKS